MATALPRVESAHVERVPDVCGGDPVIRGTRFPVKSIVVYVLRHGRTPEEIVRDWPHLTLGQVHGALAFYYDHKAEIDGHIAEEEALFERARGGA